MMTKSYDEGKIVERAIGNPTVQHTAMGKPITWSRKNGRNRRAIALRHEKNNNLNRRPFGNDI